MGAFGAVETEPAAKRVADAATRGTLSHALLLTGGGDLDALARYAAAALECTAGETPSGAGGASHGTPVRRPCGVCAACRKVLRDIHPDVVTVQDTEHKTIAADVVRSVRQDAWIRPNEGNRKVYLFPDCSLLTERDQNILLKVVEEGPPYAAFVFCAQNSASVLQTLRSRCVELKTRPAGQRDTASMRREDGEELCRRSIRGRGAVAEYAVRLERRKMSREEVVELLNWCREAHAAALLLPYGRTPDAEYETAARLLAENLTQRRILSAMELFKTYLHDCAVPVGPGHLLGALAAEWEGFS